jgi:hypothetical protein
MRAILGAVDNFADEKFRHHGSRPEAVHHQLHTASKSWKLAPTCAAPNQGY